MFKKAEKCELPEESPNIGSINFEAPILIWDGECGFCARSVKKWQNMTGSKVQYAPYQFFEADKNGWLKKFPSLSAIECQRSVALAMPDGSVSRGAEAVFRLFRLAGRRKILIWLYERFPGFKLLSEACYRLVASHRPFFSKIYR